MILIFIMITYFNCCLFFYISKYYNTQEDIDSENTFLIANNLNGTDYVDYLLTINYYMSTTVNIIGYGELYPKSNLEKIWVVGIMFTGMFMAVYFVG